MYLPTENQCEELSPDAFTLYRRLVTYQNRTERIVMRDNMQFTEAPVSWGEVPLVEMAAFHIEPHLTVALLVAHIRYTDMIGATNAHFGAYREAERRAFPQFFVQDCQHSVDMAAGFMTVACGVPYLQAVMWVARFYAQQIRTEALSYACELPEWMRNEVVFEWPEGMLPF